MIKLFEKMKGLAGKPQSADRPIVISPAQERPRDPAAVARGLGLPFLSAEDLAGKAPVLRNLPLKFLKQARCFPLEVEEDMIRVAMADPLDFYAVEAMERATGLRVEIAVAEAETIASALDAGAGAEHSLETIVGEIRTDEFGLIREEEDVDHLKDLASEAPVIRLVNLLISRAIELRSSDIHLEPFEKDFRIRYRIDGILYDFESPPKRLQSAITSRVKIMSKLNIAERRLPQDGRMKMRIGDKEIDFRVATIPTLFGESVVLRILDRSGIFFSLEHLGFPSDTLGEFEGMIRKPYGIILVTGPTGSGKTTTLYAALEKINSTEKKIITIEDPIEYQLHGVNQIQVKPQIGLTFANGLRSIVRQDPDIIMVGEIRDAETAEIAIQSALTGHLVFSTLHTNDAPGAITRLLEMGIEDYLLASSLLGVLAQRLVRVICLACKERYLPEEQVLAEIGLSGDRGKPFFRGRGCEACAQTGYRGRIGIFEWLPMGEEVRKSTLQRADAGALRERAVSLGMRTLREDGWQKVRQGLTTIEEVVRVTKEEMV
ncbi:MAG: type II secretion system ATPase GspE [Nitrospirae bacterium]|nr:type II secretion system ATPase GspE [Nitrospirota bacterium]